MIWQGGVAGAAISVETSLGKREADVTAALARLAESDIVNRIWQKDFTVWKPDPAEIADRLGWLTVTDAMREQVPALESFGGEVRRAGFRDVVLLGMGGSSLCAEVLRQVFGSRPGYPRLIVLDSTLPASIKAVEETIDPARTLFIVSSKSGTTTEPNILYKYFRTRVEKSGKAAAGENFIAITDPGTALATLGSKEGFRRVFLNQPDIGGRYSVLSYFGLVPAALIGIDLLSLLDRADGMREGCAACVPPRDNPGLALGATMGTLALKGRDKLTLIVSPAIASFGLWVEQLIAESTGKEGKGILPVVGEPLMPPDFYGDDRLFVYARLKDDDNQAADAAVKALKASGRPVVVLEMKDRLDMGGEFFRWEFATAVAGKILGINPFNQPDVQRAKEATGRLLREYAESKRLPPIETAASLGEMLAKAAAGEYFAIMAYLTETPRIDQALAALRRRVMERYRIATTVGYGPRFLHSSGQLHKGGPSTGLFLQVTAEHPVDIPVPGEPYTFGVVADAQALGDLQSLQELNRRVASVRLAGEDAGLITRLAEEIS